MTLEITISNIDNIKSDFCMSLIPQKENVIYNRLIDEDNSLKQYKDDYLSNYFYDDDEDMKMNNKGIIKVNKYDMNSTLTSLNSLFQFRFDTSNPKNMIFTYDFDINIDIARVTLLLETPFGLPIDLFAKIYLIEQDDKTYTLYDLYNLTSK